MTKFRRDAIGLVFPARSYEITPADVDAGAPLGLALTYAFAGARELMDQRMSDGPLRLWEHIVGGEIELRAGTVVGPGAGDLITSVGRVADVVDRTSGQEVIIDTASQNQHGDMLCEARFTFRLPRDGDKPDLRPRRATDPQPSASRSTQIGRFDFVEIRETPTQGSGAPELDALRAAIDVITTHAAPDAAKLRSVHARILAPAEPGSELVIHGKRDPRRAGVILFEAVGRAGLKLVDAGVAEIAQ